MTLLARILFIGGFCVATIGGGGFAEPLEDNALLLFIGGLAAVLVGGLMLRRAAHAQAHEKSDDGLSEEGLVTALTGLAADAKRLQEDAPSLDSKALCTGLDELLQGTCFDLGSHNEDYMRVLGNATYTRYWDGFAVGERLLARAWSMAADGALEEARAELPKACRNLDRAAAG